jgi:UDP-N-acetylglucosamine acyltransferase
MTKIHPTAIIDPSATVADSAVIGPYCVIGPDVTIGEDCVLHQQVCFQALTTCGRENIFYPFSVIGADPQDRKFKGEHSTCTIGDRNVVREHVTIHRGTQNGGGITRVGSDNLIMVASHVAHDCLLGDHITLANQVMLAGHVYIEDGANIGGGVGIHHFATVGTCAFVGGLARISKDVPPFMVVEGNPAEVRNINSIGMARRGFAPDHIAAVKDAFKRLYRDNGSSSMNEKLATLRETYAGIPAVVHLCNALDASADGVYGRAREVERRDNKRNGPQ